LSPKHVVVLGGGFAGLWSAVGAARKLDEMGLEPKDIIITLINRNPYHCIRVRNYEVDLSSVKVPLDRVLDPIGVEHIEADVTAIDFANRRVHFKTAAGEGSQSIGYDRLVFGLGSQLNRPAIPGSTEYGFDVDTYDGAVRLNPSKFLAGSTRIAWAI
jgi:NADH dehydrogenase